MIPYLACQGESMELQLAAHHPRPLLFRNRMLSLADPVFLPWDFHLPLFTPSVCFSSTTPGSPRTFSLLAYPHGFQLAPPPLGLLLLCLAWTFPLQSSLQCELHTLPTQESRVRSPHYPMTASVRASSELSSRCPHQTSLCATIIHMVFFLKTMF